MNPPTLVCNRTGNSSEEIADVFGQKNILIHDDLSVGDLPLTALLAKNILPAADVEVLLGLPPRAVHYEVGVDFQLVIFWAWLNLHIGDEMAGP